MDGNSAGSKSTANVSGSAPPAASNQHHGQSDSRRSQHHESSEDEDDDDRNFKHRRQRSEPRDDGYRSGDKRRHDESESSQINKYMRDSQDFKRMNNGQPHDGRGRGRGGARGRGGRPRQQCRDYNGMNSYFQVHGSKLCVIVLLIFSTHSFPERGYCMRGDLCPYDHGTDRIIVNDRVLKGQFGGNPPGPIPPNLGRPPFFGAPNNMGMCLHFPTS